jgi:hypothetical protein
MGERGGGFRKRPTQRSQRSRRFFIVKKIGRIENWLVRTMFFRQLGLTEADVKIPLVTSVTSV